VPGPPRRAGERRAIGYKAVGTISRDEEARLSHASPARSERPAFERETGMGWIVRITDAAGALRRTGLGLAAAAVFGCALAAAPARAQNDRMSPIEVPSQPGAIVLGTGPLPGDRDSGKRGTANMAAPLPATSPSRRSPPSCRTRRRATGAAVIVAPGGGFRTLSMENEGWNVARALAARGVAAFVLKYRLIQTPREMADFERSMRGMFSGASRPPPMAPGQARRASAPQLADAAPPSRSIRRRAREVGVDPEPHRHGRLLRRRDAHHGDRARDAGGQARLHRRHLRPARAVAVPPDAPPLFVALAADDPLFGNGGFGLIESWRAAHRPVEFHLYEQGGHGFGMYPKETTSTGWFDAFVRVARDARLAAAGALAAARSLRALRS
jgi:acetyl esterase/lipase